MTAARAVEHKRKCTHNPALLAAVAMTLRTAGTSRPHYDDARGDLPCSRTLIHAWGTWPRAVAVALANGEAALDAEIDAAAAESRRLMDEERTEPRGLPVASERSEQTIGIVGGLPAAITRTYYLIR